MNFLDQTLSRPQRRRALINGLGAAALALALLVAVLAFLAQQEGRQFQGTLLDPPEETLPFALQNQAGETVRWADYRGRVVVLTFLYTSCQDFCPLIAAKLERTLELLGEAAQDVAFVAITVDPERDTQEQALEFSRQWNMLGRLDFLIGSQKELEPLWEAYWVGEIRREATEGNPALAQRAEGSYLVEHTSPVHLIDRQGWDRVAYSSAFLADDLAQDILLLR